jgi:hypothetical protein
LDAAEKPEEEGQIFRESFIPPIGFGQCQNLEVVKAIARTPAQDGRSITPVILKHVSADRAGPKPADVPEGNWLPAGKDFVSLIFLHRMHEPGGRIQGSFAEC